MHLHTHCKSMNKAPYPSLYASRSRGFLHLLQVGLVPSLSPCDYIPDSPQSWHSIRQVCPGHITSFLIHPSFYWGVLSCGIYCHAVCWKPTTVAARPKARTLGSCVRIPLKAWMSIYFYSMIMLSSVGSGLPTGWSFEQGAVPIVLGLRNWSETSRFMDALCSKMEATGKTESLLKANRSFGQIYRLHLHGRKISQARSHIFLLPASRWFLS
jgi:hypothetical protein